MIAAERHRRRQQREFVRGMVQWIDRCRAFLLENGEALAADSPVLTATSEAEDRLLRYTRRHGLTLGPVRP